LALAQHDGAGLRVDGDVKSVACLYSELSPELDGEHDASQIIDSASDPEKFHRQTPSLI